MTSQPRSPSQASHSALAEAQQLTASTPGVIANASSTVQNNGEVYIVSSGSSGLSSLPSHLESTPEGFEARNDPRESERVGATREGSPISRSQRKRKASSGYDSSSSDRSTPDAVKMRKVLDPAAQFLSGSSTVVPSPETPLIKDDLGGDFSPSSESSGRTRLLSSSNESSTGEDQPPSMQRGHNIIIQESNVRVEPLPASIKTSKSLERRRTQALENDITNSFLEKIHDRPTQSSFLQVEIAEYFDSLPKAQRDCGELGHEEWKNDTMYPGFDRENPTFYQADGYIKTSTSHTAEPGSKQGSEAPSPSRKAAKGGGGKRPPPNRGKARGRGGGAGAGRDRDSPEPPNKAALSREDKVTLAHIRARQAELKKFFATVAAQQREALETLASRDLAKLLRKQRVHQKVPEFDEVFQELEEKEQSVRSIINAEYDMQIALVEQKKKAQEEIIQAQLQVRVSEAQKEHIRGAKGDLTIFANSHRAAKDGTWTENGSDVESYFPRYHELPEPDAHVRGYTSTRIRDEKSFKEQLAKYDDEAQKDVIDDDILSPVRQSVAEQNALRQAEEEGKSKQKLDELALVAEKELRKASGYLIARPLYASDNPQFALSRLADCAEYISKTHPNKAYVFVPIAPCDLSDFPRHFLERLPPPISTESTMMSTQADRSHAATIKKIIPRKQKSVSVSSKKSVKEEETQSQSSSNTSTPLPAIAPAPARMPPPPTSTQHHHHLLLPYQGPPPPPGSLPPLQNPTPLSRPPNLAPLVLSKSQISPPSTPTYGPPVSMPHQVPPPPSPASFQPSPGPQQFAPPPSHHQRFSGHFAPVLHPSYHEQPPRMPGYVRAPPLSPLSNDQTLSMQSQQNRFSIPGYGRSRTPRPAGPRRNSGQITFTQINTPNSSRFRPNPSPTTNVTPSNQAPLPAPPQQQPPAQSPASNGELARSTTPMTAPVGRMVNHFVNQRVDGSTLADTARQNAARAQGQGAGPKGGKRVLLPKAQC